MEIIKIGREVYKNNKTKNTKVSFNICHVIPDIDERLHPTIVTVIMDNNESTGVWSDPEITLWGISELFDCLGFSEYVVTISRIGDFLNALTTIKDPDKVTSIIGFEIDE